MPPAASALARLLLADPEVLADGILLARERTTLARDALRRSAVARRLGLLVMVSLTSFGSRESLKSLIQPLLIREDTLWLEAFHAVGMAILV